MQATAIKLPKDLHEANLLRIPASWDDYLELLTEADQTHPTLTIQYLNNEIIMSQASAIHEELVINIGWLLKSAFRSQRQYHVLGSSIKIVIPDHKGDFNADVSVVNGTFEYGASPKGKPTNVRITNPEIVVEVLSKSTRKFDEGPKLAQYKRITTLKYILLVDQDEPYVSVYSRTETPGQWLNQDYWSLDETVRFGEVELPMQEIYNK